MTKFYPAIPRNLLYLTASLLWTIVGLFLILTAVAWLFPFADPDSWILAAVGIFLGVAGYHGPFSSLARKNISRIREKPQKSCFFGFQATRGYLLIALMIPLGFVLKNSPLPRDYLAVAYLAVGTALALASFLYYPYILGAPNEHT